MNRTIVDWFGFRTASPLRPTVEALQGLFGDLGSTLEARPRANGYMGFEESADLILAGMRVGLIAHGGASQRGWVSANVTGEGCAWVRDWDVAQDVLGELPSFQLRRLDIALDTRDRSVSHESVVDAYRSGLFNTRGRPPNMQRIESEDPTKGRTVYVGSRDQAKFFRGYEKGYQLAKGFPGTCTHIDGVPIGDLYRCELELKVKQAPLPADLIDRRDQYFAGSYPYLEHLLEVEPEIFVQRRERAPQVDLAAALATIRHQYGRTLFTALAAYHGDFMAVWDRIVGREHSQALVEAGVLLVDHDQE